MCSLLFSLVFIPMPPNESLWIVETIPASFEMAIRGGRIFTIDLEIPRSARRWSGLCELIQIIFLGEEVSEKSNFIWCNWYYTSIAIKRTFPCTEHGSYPLMWCFWRSPPSWYLSVCDRSNASMSMIGHESQREYRLVRVDTTTAA